MPTAQERIPNKSLSGDELKELMRQDFDHLLTNDGLLGGHMAYGRVGYDIILRMHMDNPMMSKSESRTSGKPSKDNPQIEPAPLRETTDEAIVAAVQRSRTIESPNAERLRAGMPVPVEVRDADRTVRTEMVRYPKTADEGDVVQGDVSAQAMADWGILDIPQEVKLPEDGDGA
jgi:hypothetical protein